MYGCSYANVQPHSGAQANQAVFLALIKPGDTILGMSLDAGGHLTHGSRPNQSGKYFNAVQYGINPETSLIDYDEVERLAIEHKPTLIIAGGSAYPRNIDFKKFREIADKIEAYLLVDMAHYSGLVAAKEYPDPLPHAHVVTSTTHKTIRGPRGGMILSNDLDLGKKFNSSVFPGLQGGPLMHVIAAKAVAFGEALQPEFKTYIQQVKKNASILGEVLISNGIDIVTGGTDSHMVLVDLRSKNVTGKDAEESLERAGMTCNKNGVANDPNPPTITSGIRLGSPAATTRGFKEEEFKFIGEKISTIINALSSSRRRRLCGCERKERFTTFERVQFREFLVVKKNGEKSMFDRDKIAKSVELALRKRPVDIDTKEKLISKIVRDLEGMGENEVSTNTIGEMVMQGLYSLDKVGYVRFASVYRDFRETKDFEQFLEKIDKK